MFLWVLVEAILLDHYKLQVKLKHLRLQWHYRRWEGFLIILKIPHPQWAVEQFSIAWEHRVPQFSSHMDLHPWVLFWEGHRDTKLCLLSLCSPLSLLQVLLRKGFLCQQRPKSTKVYLSKSVYSENREIGVHLCITHHVKVYEFL